MTIEEKLKVLELPKKKKGTENILYTRYLMAKEEPEKIEKRIKGAGVFRDAVLSASTSPFLRAVILSGENETHYYLSIFSAAEEPLEPREAAGTLIKRRKGALPIKESAIRYEIKMHQVRKALEEEMEKYHLTRIALANVHHDYVRYFGEPNAVEEVILFHILHKDSSAVEKVIRKV